MSSLHSILALTLALAACEPMAIHHAVPVDDPGDSDTVNDALTVDQGWHREGAWLVSPPLPAEATATHVNLLISLAGDAPLTDIEARGLLASTPTGDWVVFAETFVEASEHVAAADVAGPVDAVVMRFPADDLASLVRLHWGATTLTPGVIPDADDTGAEAVASVAPLRPELSGLAIVTRAEWGARPTTCGVADTAKDRVTLHHTETASSEPARQLRALQAYDIGKGWCDIGYHFLIGGDGAIYEGRDLDLRGVHTRNDNTGNVGIAFIGSYDAAPPNAAMLSAAAHLLAALSPLYGIDLDATTVRGHRDVVDTSCPGAALEAQLPMLLTAAHAVSAMPTLPPPPAPTPAPGDASCVHSLGGAYASTACTANYQCCDGGWRMRVSGCGACVCEETSGRVGCGL